MNIETKDTKKGRPSAYKDEYAGLAFNYTLLGAIDTELAGFFGVSKTTLNAWKKHHPEFLASIQKGKVIADAEVALSLYKSATGGHIVKEDKLVSDGVGGQKVITLEKQLEPSVTAQIFWLKNRQPDKWKDKQEVNNNIKIDKELMHKIETEFLERLARARERQKEVLRERGILSDDD
jgi:hypothetical protein